MWSEPRRSDRDDLAGRILLRVHENRIGACVRVTIGSVERLLHTGAIDQRLGPGNNHEVGIVLCSLCCLDLPSELVNVKQILPIVDETVRLRKGLVLDAHTGDARGLVPLNQVGDVGDPAKAGVAVGHYGDLQRVLGGHGGLQVLDHGQQAGVG